MEILDGTITEYTPRGDMTIATTYGNVERFIKCGYSAVRIMLCDNRSITAEQRKKIYAMIAEIADFVGEYPELMKKQLKLEFRLRRLEKMAEDFSLSDCSVELASEFIDFLVETIVAWDVPCKQPLTELCEDIRKYVYVCLKYKKCAVCGRKADLHHVDAVGMGFNRKEIAHEGKRALPLCRAHHTEAHGMGNDDFMKRYGLEPIALDKALCKVYKFKTKGEEKEYDADG